MSRSEKMRTVGDLSKKLALISILRHLRKQKGMNYSEFAVFIGVYPSQLREWDKCKRFPNMATVEKIAKTLNLKEFIDDKKSKELQADAPVILSVDDCSSKSSINTEKSSTFVLSRIEKLTHLKDSIYITHTKKKSHNVS